MKRVHSLFGGLFTSNAPGSATRRPAALVEVLEDRRLLSAAIINPGGPNIPAPTPTPVTVARGHGVTLHLTAGQNFNGYLGDLPGAKVPAGFVRGASIDWGDGTQSNGNAAIGPKGNIDVSGTHTYAKAGKYAISIGVTATPGPVAGKAAVPIILLLGTISSTAVVDSSGGVTLKETAGARFTATLGTFSYIAPGTGLHATIEWGDGTSPSTGTIVSTGVSGIDVINYKVTGTHTYARAGTYPIIVTVTRQLGPPGSLAPIQLITTIDSTAIVSSAGLNLDGTITGRLLPAPTAVTFGGLYIISDATGTAGVMGPVSATGDFHTPPISTIAPVVGLLTLTSVGTSPANPSGSVTLTLTGPTQSGTAPLPKEYTYVITGGTGSFAKASGTGSIDLSLTNGLDFKLTIASK